MKTLLFDDPGTGNLLPLTFTRPAAAIRVGILTIKEKWERYLELESGYYTREYLSKKFPGNTGKQNIFINGRVLPNPSLVQAVKSLGANKAIVSNEVVIAANIGSESINKVIENDADGLQLVNYTDKISLITHPWDIFSKVGAEIEADYQLLTPGRKSAPVSETNNIINDQNIFLEEGARVECATINATSGPVYLGKGAEIMEGAMIRGPFVLGDHSTIKMGAKIYGPTAIGPHCKVGGEVNNSVFLGYANKAHDGFLGNSVIGEWCNLGADTNNSNLKNNYALVKLWNYHAGRFVSTGLQFCGLIMGDHSKAGINTMFNTGTVVGVNANIFGSGFPRNFIPSYSWGGAQGMKTYAREKAYEVAELVMARRDIKFDETEKDIMEHIFKETEQYRRF